MKNLSTPRGAVFSHLSFGIANSWTAASTQWASHTAISEAGQHSGTLSQASQNHYDPLRLEVANVLNDFKCSNQTCVKSPRIVEFSNFVCYLNHFKSTCSQIEHASNANLSASNAVVVPRPLPLVHPLDLTRISHQQGITRHYNIL